MVSRELPATGGRKNASKMPHIGAARGSQELSYAAWPMPGWFNALRKRLQRQGVSRAREQRRT